jgi:hypothetical protein
MRSQSTVEGCLVHHRAGAVGWVGHETNDSPGEAHTHFSDPGRLVPAAVRRGAQAWALFTTETACAAKRLE